MTKMRAAGFGKVLRVVLPLLIVVAWLGLSAVGGPYFGKISDVADNDLAAFLPKSAESTKVNNELKRFNNSSTIPAVVVFNANSGLTSRDKATLNKEQTALNASPVVDGEVASPVVSSDQKAAILLIPLDGDSDFGKDIPSLKQTINSTDSRLAYKFTGPAMFSRDLNKAFAGIDGTLLFVALGVVFFILLIVYRSPILPVVTLSGSIMALSGAILVIWHLADEGILRLNGQVQGILFILVIGATTDYSLLYIARYREELSRHKRALQATTIAWKAAWEPILAAGGTVVLGLLCLLASDLGSNKALGPVGGIGIGFAILSALTFLPAAMLLLGRRAFWPRQPHYETNAAALDYHNSHPVWAKISRFVGRHPRRLWIGIVAVLVVSCLFVPQLKASGTSQSDLILGKSEAREGQSLLDQHFPGGSGSPASVLVAPEHQAAVVKLLEADKGVDSVSVVTTDRTKSPAPVGQLAASIQSGLRTNIQRQYPDASPATIDMLTQKAYTFSGTQPKVLDNREVLQATLKDAASSVPARQTIKRLRETIQPQYPDVMFGGFSAIQLDTNNASTRDLEVIIPLILAAITIVLMVLLRSLMAPLVLLLTTVLSFGATMGISALLFNHAWHYPGGDPAVVIYGFVFLVALGIDYNIFLMTRVREETLRLGVRTGTLKAVAVTGGVITSAGIVLASTFAALFVIPILFLAQIAFIVAFGVLLDTLVVRSLLVPALTLQVGKAMWWPSKLWRKSR